MTAVVVGAGLAGLRTCEALRKHGYDGDVVLVGEEPHPPYTRPPLSKEVLRGAKQPETALLSSAEELAGIGVRLRTRCRAAGLDLDGRQVQLDDGSSLRYDDLVIATGAHPRRLPGADGPAVHVLRTLDDCVSLGAAIGDGVRLVVVGAGFIGLEVAATARTVGAQVTVVDPLPAPLARALDPRIGAAIGRLHAEHGVDIRCGVGVEALDGSQVRLSEGTGLDADVVVVGIGVVPATGWLEESGLRIDNGVLCDATLQAAPDVWAVGDVARWWVEDVGTHVRVEHWTNATEQPDVVARNIVGSDPAAFDTVPYFWSDQYDAKLQSLGYPADSDEMLVVRGSLEEPKFVALLRKGDRLAGVVGLRSAGPVMRLRRLLAERASWDEALAQVTGA